MCPDLIALVDGLLLTGTFGLDMVRSIGGLSGEQQILLHDRVMDLISQNTQLLSGLQLHDIQECERPWDITYIVSRNPEW